MDHAPTLSTIRELRQTLPNSSINERIVLLLIAQDVKRPMSRIALEVGVTSGGMTTIVDRLRNLGLVRRYQDEADRRPTYLQVTSKGAKAIASAEKRAMKDVA